MSECPSIAARNSLAGAVCLVIEEQDPKAAEALRTPGAVFDEAVRRANLEFTDTVERLRTNPGARLQLPFLEVVQARAGVLFPWIPYDFDPRSPRDEEVVRRLLGERDRFHSLEPQRIPQEVLQFLTRPQSEGGLGFGYGEFELDPERGVLELLEEPTFTNCAEWTSPTYLAAILWDLPIVFLIVPGPVVHLLPAIDSREGPLVLDLERRAVYLLQNGRRVSPRVLVAAHHHNRSYGGNCVGKPTPLLKVECQLQEAERAASVAPEEGLFRRQRDELARQRERLIRAAEDARRTGRPVVVDY